MVQVQPTCVDLFSGCGGFGLGAKFAGFDIVAAVDIDADLQSAYRLNFPETHAFQADISQLEQSAWEFVIGRDSKRLDLLMGGPPCQGFSRMGKHQHGDPRNTLVAHFFRHVRLLQPRMFIMENVEGLMDNAKIGFLHNALAELPNTYQIVGPVIINAADLGAPTSRRRVIVVGYDKRDVDQIDAQDIEALKHSERVTVREAISDLPGPISDMKRLMDFGWASYPDSAVGPSIYAQRCRALPECQVGGREAMNEAIHGRVSGLFATQHSNVVIDRFLETPQGAIEPVSRYPKLAWAGQCPTLRAGTGAEKGSFQAVRPIHPTQPRVITVREGARLQGFPDWFLFHPTKWHSFRMIGNSVSPIVSAALSTLLYNKSVMRQAA